MLVRIKAGETQQAVAALQQLCKEFNPKFPFTYQFSDLEYAKLYKSEQVVSKLSNLFAFLAIFISCLGLFGLAMFTAEQRNKEIGIRKVMGASVPSLTVLLSREFTKLVLVAFIPAALAGWYMSNYWLESFAYRIDINPMVIIISGIGAIVVAWLTVSFQSIKAATSNPVDSLRYE